MRLIRPMLFALGIVAAAPSVAMAASCFDLWYERNQIYDDNGYCFKSDLALEYFDNGDCRTRHPHFTKTEQRRIDEIVAEEKRRHCDVS